MKKVVRALAWRSIRTSKGRWIAIFLIVLLSVGFYSGFQICKPQFWKACENYLNSQTFYDYRLYSSLGFSSDDVQKLSEVDGISDAEGQKSIDATVTYGNHSGVFELRSLPERINLPSLVAGRLPENENECVVDHRAFPDDFIGSEITVDGDTEGLGNQTFTVVGTVNSPLYLNADRGSTSLGNGVRDGFIYITEDNFTSDYYTEIDLTLDGADSYAVYSDEYSDLVDSHKNAVQTCLDECASARYDDIITEIQDEADQKAEEALSEIRSAASSAKAEQESQIENAVNQAKSELDAAVAAGRMTQEQEDAQLQTIRAQAEQQAAESFTPISVDDFAKEQNLTDEETDAFREALGKDEIESLDDLINLEIAPMTREEAVSEASDNGIDQPTTYLLTREENEGYVSFRSDTSIISAIAAIFPLFFILIALLVCVTTMTRMVEEERTQIGTMKAIGYSSTAITMKYLLYAGSATALGWAAGFFIGTYAVPKGFWAAYSTLYDFIDLPYVFSPGLAVLTLIVSLAAILFSVWISCRSELLSTPARLIRPRASKPGSRILLERFTPLWSRLSFLRKATLRNMFRYKFRMIMMLIGIGCCTALVVTAFGVRDSMIHVGDLQYDEIQTYDLTVSTDGGEITEIENEISDRLGDQISGMIPAVCETVRAVQGEDSGDNGPEMNSVTLMSFEDGTDLSGYWTFTDWEGKETLDLPGEGGALISRRLAEKLGLKTGDTICVEESAVTGGETKSAVLTVVGVYRNYIGNFVFISSGTYEKYFADEDQENGALNTILVRTKNTADDELLETINDIDGVSGVSDLEESRNSVNHSLECLDYIIWLIVLFSGALAFIVIFNLTNINLAERSREIATVEVLGFYPRETRRYILSENIMLSVLAGLIGLPLGYLFCRFVISRILIDQMTYRFTIYPVSYVLGFACTILFVFIVNLFMRRRIASIDMAESLKAVE